MRICILTQQFPAATETFISEPVEWLRRQGHRVSVIAERAGKLNGESKGAAPRAVRIVNGGLSRRQEIRLLVTHPARAAAVWRRAIELEDLHDLSIAEFVSRSLLPEIRRADCVLAHFGPVGVEWLPVAAAARRPFAVYFHGYDATSYVRDHPEAYARLFRSGALLVTNGSYLRGRLIDAGADPTHVSIVRYAVSPAIADASNRVDLSRRRIITIARLVEKKGLEDSLRAFALAQDVMERRWNYDIIGEGTLRPKLERLIGELGIGDLVRLRGFLHRAETLTALLDSSVFCLASKTAASGDTEGTPVSIIEATVLGLPVISTRHAGIPELLPPEAGDKGYMVGEGDVDGLARALRTLTRSPHERAGWGKDCRRYAVPRAGTQQHVEALVAALSAHARAPVV